MSCQYSPAWHSSERANAQAVAQCVNDTMSKMSDPSKCIAYFGSVADNVCQISDLESICTGDRVRSFSVEDARGLCTAKHDAESKWWQTKLMS